VDVEHPRAELALRDVLRRFPLAEGYRVDVKVEVDERRILETGPCGRLRMLAREPIFQPWVDKPSGDER
jgi:hypothetical protein